MNHIEFNQHYNHEGYCVIRNYFSQSELATLRKVILTFHTAWKKDNLDFYQDDAFNSSLITGSQYLNSQDRLALFNFISSDKMMNVINMLIPNDAGDVLLFSADMIHRGVYGLNRLALDILVFDPSGDFVDYVDNDCLPNKTLLTEISNPDLYKSTMRLKTLCV